MSPLLCLPTEIRLQIYELVVPSRTVHVRTGWSGIGKKLPVQSICCRSKDSVLQIPYEGQCSSLPWDSRHYISSLSEEYVLTSL
jgi:hypothetical protein